MKKAKEQKKEKVSKREEKELVEDDGWGAWKDPP